MYLIVYSNHATIRYSIIHIYIITQQMTSELDMYTGSYRVPVTTLTGMVLPAYHSSITLLLIPSVLGVVEEGKGINNSTVSYFVHVHLTIRERAARYMPNRERDWRRRDCHIRSPWYHPFIP